MVRPLAHYLVEFGPPPLADALDKTAGGTECVEPSDPPPAADPATLLQEARDEGMAEGLVVARAEYETQLRQESLAFEGRLVAERDQWTRQESERLSEDIKTIFTVIESQIAASVGRVLTPFVADAMRRRMIELLAETINVLLSGKECPVIEIRGPSDLLALLREKLAVLPGAIDCVAADSIDVRIAAGQTIIETRIEAWLERIKSLPE
jgi:hypothetical protein